MALRCCIYKNCENYINLKDRSFNENLKLFGFPKNPERRQKWMELGKVPPNLPPSMYYFCSDHFDRKFFAVNNRRTSLVGEAVPFPYVEPEIDENFEADSNLDYYLYEMNKDSDVTEKQQMQSEHVESTTMQDDTHEEVREEHCSISFDEQESETCFIFPGEDKESNEDEKYHRRKVEKNIVTESSSSKAKTLKILTTIKPIKKTIDIANMKSQQIVNLKDLDVESTTTLENLNEDIDEEHFSIKLEDNRTEECVLFPGEMEFEHNTKCNKRKIDDNILTESTLSKVKLLKKPMVKNIQKSYGKSFNKFVDLNTSKDTAVINIERESDEVDLEELIDTRHVTTFIYKGEEYVQMPKYYYVQEKLEITRKLQNLEHTIKSIKECLNCVDF